jgi:dienelactone hydrolase
MAARWETLSDKRASFHPRASADAWEKTLAWFEQDLKS